MEVNVRREYSEQNVRGDESHTQAANLYRDRGYTVAEITPHSTSERLRKLVPEAVLNQIESSIAVAVDKDDSDVSPLKAIERNGVPDLFIYRQTMDGDFEYAFVEAKRPSGSLTKEQVNWLVDFSLLSTRLGYILR